jgi:23S rRNA pseudouridine2605 synthase
MALVPLARALSKLGLMSRREAGAAIRVGRVAVDGRVVRDQAHPVSLARAAIEVDGRRAAAPAWRTILFHKPRGVLTTTRDPEHRPTVFDLLGAAGHGLRAVGRLDFASTGLLLLTSDSRLADWLTSPAHRIPRVYLVTVRGSVDDDTLSRLTAGVTHRGEILRAASATLVKVSGRESQLTIALREGKNREIRRMFESMGREVTRLKRVAFGPLQLGDLPPGRWREITRGEIVRAFGGPALGRRAGG